MSLMSSRNREPAETGLPWHVVEEAINREIEWLETAIEQTSADKVPGCDDCRYTYRKIALLIVTGKIKAKEFIARDGHDLWDDLTRKHALKGSARHGGDWHKKMMNVITEYFENQGFDVVSEPFLTNGRADLGIYKDGHKDLFVEVGTTSAYKLCLNLQTLTNSKILLVPDEKRAVEFTCREYQDDMLRSAQGEGSFRNVAAC
jgi:hypothetical protein